MTVKQIGKALIRLKTDFDLSFLSRYGEPFAVFDDQDSGNLCFGVEGREGRRFLKLAGAPTIRGTVSAGEAVERLKATVPLYQALKHPKLLGMLEHGPVDGGYLAVFPWFEGKCMGKQYDSYHRFLRLPLEEKLVIYSAVLEFHRFVNERGYVAVDFYDGSILYSFKTKQVMLCDIEMYQKMPCTNTMGRMWGSDRYMSPEEFQLGAIIDERTNVYGMGATAFNLIGGGSDHSPERWNAPRELFEVAKKAVNAEKADRYPSIAAYQEAWEQAAESIRGTQLSV